MYAEGKPEAIDELVARLRPYDHEEGKVHKPHFWGVFEAEVDDIKPREPGTRVVGIYGYCAQSVHACMLDGNGTCADGFKTDPHHASHCTSLGKTSDELGIEIEVFSHELAESGFSEHYHYIPGGPKTEERGDCFWSDENDEYLDGFHDVIPFCFGSTCAES